MAEDRFALIVATYDYRDPEFSKLCAPAQDAEDMARVLADPEIGDFTVTKLVNSPSSHVKEEIEQFFLDRRVEDTLLLYFSGHGIKDEEGKLFFATANTRRKLLHSTAVPAKFVNEVMNKSRSRKMIILLDCCHAGAFAKGMVVKGGQEIGTAEFLKGQGRVVITASDAMQYAFEGDTMQTPAGEPVRSIFTGSLVQGLETGEADKDGDGSVSVNELYDYVHDRVTSQTPHQRPKRWEFDVHGDILVAHNPKPKSSHSPLSAELIECLNDRRPWVREGAVAELNKILQGNDEGLKNSALQALQGMVSDDSHTIRTMVSKILINYKNIEPGPEPVIGPTNDGPSKEEISSYNIFAIYFIFFFISAIFGGFIGYVTIGPLLNSKFLGWFIGTSVLYMGLFPFLKKYCNWPIFIIN